MEKIPGSHAEPAPGHMSERLYLASIMAEMQGANPKRKWTDEVSPAMAGKCRHLGKAATDKGVQSYSAEVYHLGKTLRPNGKFSVRNRHLQVPAGVQHLFLMLQALQCAQCVCSCMGEDYILLSILQVFSVLYLGVCFS